VNTHLREEKKCLNCGNEISDRYCSHCGQENVNPKESTGHLVGHFVSDITHYDSKFLTTIRDLLFRPGFLTTEYLTGRRVRYLNPVRMYIFISFIFFITLFAQKKNEMHASENQSPLQHLNTEKQYLADSLKKSLRHIRDSSVYGKLKDSVVRNIAASLDTIVPATDTSESIGISVSTRGFLFTRTENRYNSLQEYDSVQKSLPDKEKDGFFGRLFTRKNISIKKRLGSASEIAVEEEFQHNVPKLMFVLLPLFALLLLIFYRKRKVTYAGHIIFSVHYHSFAFLVLFLMNLVNMIAPSFSFSITVLIISLLLLYLYLVVALKNVYRQSFFISTLKGLVISIIYILLLVISLGIWALALFFLA